MKKSIFLLIAVIFFQSNVFCQSQSAFDYGFIENKGQIVDQYGKPNEEVLFLIPVNERLNIHLKKDGFSYETFSRNKAGKPMFHRIDISILNCNNAEITAVNPLEDYINYYTTGLSDNSAYKTRHYQEIRYNGIYKGIDMVFKYNPESQQKVKFDFVLNDQANINDIRLKYSGYEYFKLLLNLEIGLVNGYTLIEEIPSSWYTDNNESVQVDYELVDVDRELKEFVIGYKCDKKRAMVIDPIPDLDWSTYYGDTLIDGGTDVITDNWGMVYMTGYTQSYSNFATSGVHQDTLAGGMFDTYLTKFTPFGSKIWSTYYGGTGTDISNAIMVDTFFNVVITGYTDSPDGIASTGCYQDVLSGAGTDAFIAKFDDTGNRIWSTYFGGTGNEIGTGIDTDYDASTYVVGTTESSNSAIATTGAYQTSNAGSKDGFVLKLDSSGVPVWSTYYGGPDDDSLSSIAVEWNSILVCGTTNSNSGIHTSGAYQTTYEGNQDAFLAYFDQTGTKQWSSYYGGPGQDLGNDIEVYNTRIYLVGRTDSDTLIASTSGYKTSPDSVDAYLAKFDTLGNRLWATYYGGPSYDEAIEVGVELDSNVYIYGNTFSDSLIATYDGYDTTYNGNGDAFIAKFFTSGFLTFATYYGGSENDVLKGGDIYGNTAIYIGGTTNSTGIDHDAIVQDSLAGATDAFLAKFITDKSTISNGGICTGNGNSGQYQFCEGPLTFYTVGGALGIGANWVWYEGGCGSVGTQLAVGDTVVLNLPVGFHHIFVRAESVTNATNCADFIIEVVPNPVAQITINDTVFCAGDLIDLSGGTGDFYFWSGPNGFSMNQQDTIIDSAAITHTGQYILEVQDSIGCFDKDTVDILVHDLPALSYAVTPTSCPGWNDGAITVVPSGVGPFSYNWSPPVDTVSTIDSLYSGAYFITLVDSNQCSIYDSIYVSEPSSPIQNMSSTPNVCSSNSGTATVSLLGGAGLYQINWSPGGYSTDQIAGLNDGLYTVYVTDTIGCQYQDTVTVAYQSDLTIQSIVSDSITCFGGDNGAIQISVLSGQSPFTYLWQPNGQTTAGINNLSAGLYTVLVTDDNGCTATDSITLFDGHEIIVSLDSINHAHCGQSDGEIFVSTSGGNGGFTFNWVPSGITFEDAHGVVAGFHTLTITDMLGCTQNFTANVSDLPGPSVSINTSAIQINAGQQVDLEAVVSPSGNYIYNWTPPNLVDCPTCAMVQSFPSLSSLYTVTVVDEFGCADTASIFIRVIPCGTYFLPDIFSPNDDGLNDEWNIMGQCIASYNLSVFNRWGEIIFHTENATSSWDGTYKGKDVDVGSYVYQLEIEYDNGDRISDSGNIKVVR